MYTVSSPAPYSKSPTQPSIRGGVQYASGSEGQAPAPVEQSVWEGVVPSLAGKTVVVVEDEAITQLQIRRALTRAGMQVLGFAGTGVDGVETVLRTRPDLVLMDIKMPGDLNGLEATKLILQQLQTCVIVLTAYDEFRDEAMQSGACGYLVKPVSYQTLIPKVKAAFENFYVT